MERTDGSVGLVYNNHVNLFCSAGTATWVILFLYKNMRISFILAMKRYEIVVYIFVEQLLVFGMTIEKDTLVRNKRVSVQSIDLSEIHTITWSCFLFIVAGLKVVDIFPSPDLSLNWS